jgi:hypothetical protein
MNDHSSENQPEPLALTRKKALQQKRKDILSLTPEAMLDRILSEDNPLPLVHSFPEEDLYFILHEIGLEDSLPVLALASAKQMDFVLDREIWRKDRMDVHALARWMNHMMEADAHRFTRWLMDEKTDLLEIFLHQAVEVRQREHDEDPSDFGDDFMTLDSVLYYRIHGVLKTAFEQDSVPGEDSEQVMPHQKWPLKTMKNIRKSWWNPPGSFPRKRKKTLTGGEMSGFLKKASLRRKKPWRFMPRFPLTNSTGSGNRPGRPAKHRIP